MINEKIVPISPHGFRFPTETEMAIDETMKLCGTSWRDVPYLSGEKLGQMTEEQWLYLRRQQIKWVRPSIMACILIGLHRKYGYGYDRCLRVYKQIQAIEDEYKGNQKKICKAALEEVGVDIDDMMHRRRREAV